MEETVFESKMKIPLRKIERLSRFLGDPNEICDFQAQCVPYLDLWLSSMTANNMTRRNSEEGITSWGI